MVFSSVPVYLDPPNWHHHQQPNQQQGSRGGATNENPQLPPLPPPHVSSGGGGGGGGGGNGSIRPGSMSDRARLAKIPQPEVALKCPRCDSTNTKFCYYNNYSLSQPRHFCKTCRRYWTRGGALRSVPVGGGCRRNKKTKSHSNSKSPVSNNERQMSSTSASTTPIPSDIITHLPPQPNHQLPFMTSLHNLANHHQFGVGNVGLNFGAIATTTSNEQNEMGFHNHQIGSNSSGGVVQQFPFFEAPILPTSLLFPFQSEGVLVEASSTSSSSRVNSQMAPVKMEDNNQGLNLLSSSKPFMGISESNNQFWGGNTWTDLSGLNSSSTTHLL